MLTLTLPGSGGLAGRDRAGVGGVRRRGRIRRAGRSPAATTVGRLVRGAPCRSACSCSRWASWSPRWSTTASARAGPPDLAARRGRCSRCWRSPGLAAVLANLINNLPAVLALLPLARPGRAGPVLAALLGVNLGPNLTYVGSLATLLWRRILREHDNDAGLGEFTRLGLLTVPARAGRGDGGAVGGRCTSREADEMASEPRRSRLGDGGHLAGVHRRRPHRTPDPQVVLLHVIDTRSQGAATARWPGCSAGGPPRTRPRLRGSIHLCRPARGQAALLHGPRPSGPPVPPRRARPAASSRKSPPQPRARTCSSWARDGDHTRLGPRSLGPATRFVVDHAPCPVCRLARGGTRPSPPSHPRHGLGTGPLRHPTEASLAPVARGLAGVTRATRSKITTNTEGARPRTNVADCARTRETGARLRRTSEPWYLSLTVKPLPQAATTDAASTASRAATPSLRDAFEHL